MAQGVKVPRVGALRVGVPLASRLVDHVENTMEYSHMTSTMDGGGYGVGGPESCMKVI